MNITLGITLYKNAKNSNPYIILCAFVKIVFLTVCDVLILIFQLQIDDGTTGDEYYETH